MEQHAYRVLLFYKFVRIEDPAAFTAEHLQYCKELGIKGRILIAAEEHHGFCSEACREAALVVPQS